MSGAGNKPDRAPEDRRDPVRCVYRSVTQLREKWPGSGSEVDNAWCGIYISRAVRLAASEALTITAVPSKLSCLRARAGQGRAPSHPSGAGPDVLLRNKKKKNGLGGKIKTF